MWDLCHHKQDHASLPPRSQQDVLCIGIKHSMQPSLVCVAAAKTGSSDCQWSCLASEHDLISTQASAQTSWLLRPRLLCPPTFSAGRQKSWMAPSYTRSSSMQETTTSTLRLSITNRMVEKRPLCSKAPNLSLYAKLVISHPCQRLTRGLTRSNYKDQVPMSQKEGTLPRTRLRPSQALLFARRWRGHKPPWLVHMYIYIYICTRIYVPELGAPNCRLMASSLCWDMASQPGSLSYPLRLHQLQLTHHLWRVLPLSSNNPNQTPRRGWSCQVPLGHF